MALIVADKLYDALKDAGLISDVDSVRRVIIDLQVGEIPIVHIERFGDERLLALIRSLDGIEIRRLPAQEVAG